MVVRLVSGPQPRRIAPIFAVTDDREEDQLFLGQDRIALLLHLRSGFEAWGLRELIARQPLFPGLTPGDTVTIEAGMADRALTIRSRSGIRELTTQLPLTVGLGWSGLMPFRYPVFNEWALFNALWLAGLIGPTGYWAGRWSPGRAVMVLIAVLVGGLVAIPSLTAAAATTRPEWIGAAVGALTGWASGTWSRRHHPVEPGAP